MNLRQMPALLLVMVLSALKAFSQPQLPEKFDIPVSPIELSRVARPASYIEAVGRKAAIFGNEAGIFESWVFPIKLFHDARLSIQIDGQDAPIEFSACIDRIIVRPESTTLIASDQLFTIRAHFFTPIAESGSVILLDVDTTRPMTVTVSFVPDLKPMWPGGLGGQAAYWRDDLKAFIVTESRRKVNGFFGSPAATRGVATPAHQLASGALRFDIRIDPAISRTRFYPLIIAGSSKDRPTAVNNYNAIAASIPQHYARTVAHYRRLQDEMMSIESPDTRLNQAFEWAKASLDKGMVDNPDLGLGLVAGWNSTGEGARPGFGWYFGGDAGMNSFALTAAGDFENVRATFRFLAKYQRVDGKIPHEISQAAGLVKWFEEYPYAFLHADTTPLYIAAVYNYYLQSGDQEFIRELWPVLTKSYRFCLDNDTDGDGILENSKAGLGASELGTLLEDLHQDVYLAATNLEASRAIAALAQLLGDLELAGVATDRLNKATTAIEARYWNAAENRYAYALTKSGKQNMEITAWSALPMMFGQFDSRKVGKTLADLASSNMSTDWGIRMLGTGSPAYDPVAYNNGGVWPFLTGFASLGEYQYSRRHAAFHHLRQIGNLVFDFALGYRPEILSGNYYRPLGESVPHQFFSAAMTITPLVRGLLGLRVDAAKRVIGLTPQIPDTWDHLKVRNIRLGATRIGLEAHRVESGVQYVITKSDTAPLTGRLALRLPYLAQPVRVTVDGRAVTTTQRIEEGQTICSFDTPLAGNTVVEVAWRGGVDIDIPFRAPQVGDSPQSLRVHNIAVTGEKKIRLTLEGIKGRKYEIRLRGGVTLSGTKGGTAAGERDGWKIVEVMIPGGGVGAWKTVEVELEFR